MTAERQDTASVGLDDAWTFRLLSWNLHALPLAQGKQRRLDQASAQVVERDPDVVLLQEIWASSDRRRLLGNLGSRYVPVEGPTGGWLRPRPSGLLCLVRRTDDWAITTSSFHPFVSHGPIWRVWESDGLAGKGVMRVDLEYQGRPLTIFNTHFQAEYGETRYTEIRAAQMRELRNLARQIPSGIAVVAAGDLNTRPEEDELLDHLLSDWTDLGQDVREQCGCGTYIRQDGRPDDWVDYILGRAPDGGRIRAASFEVIRNVGLDDPYSDHHGLIATVEIASDPGQASLLLGMLMAPGVQLTRRQWLAAITLGWRDSLGRGS